MHRLAGYSSPKTGATRTGAFLVAVVLARRRRPMRAWATAA